MKRASQFVTLASVLLVIMACEPGAPETKINIISSDEAMKAAQPGVTIVDPTSALQSVSQVVPDIDEDSNDPFITSKSGKLRPPYTDSQNSLWAGEMPARLETKITQKSGVLVRKKRCDRNDDDSNARRSARRARRRVNGSSGPTNQPPTTKAKRTKRQKKKARRAKSTSTTVTRKVIQNGQVVSQTTETQGGVGTVPTGQVQVASGQPQVVQTVPRQPIVVQQQQPAAAAVSAVPSISVQNSVKIN